MNQVIQGDCLDVMRGMADCGVDAVVTDPPYGLSFMGRAWDYDVPQVEIWREVLRVLKPGGHLLSFAGTRTQHRMAVNIEYAGFDIRDMLAWVYGSGFPKSHDISKAIDRESGADREVVGLSIRLGDKKPYGQGWGQFGECKEAPTITAPATPEAQQWEGWGSALKPALEPITLARKPLQGTLAQNVQEHGTGGLNIDGCRVGTGEAWSRPGGLFAGKKCGIMGEVVPRGPSASNPTGRWPANLIHDGSPDVLGVFPESSGSAARFFKACPHCDSQRLDKDGFDRTLASGKIRQRWRCKKCGKKLVENSVSAPITLCQKPIHPN